MELMGSALAAGAAAPAAGKKTGYYALGQYFLRNGTQMGRVHELFRGGLLPALNKIHRGPKMFLEALVAPHMPQVASILGFSSLEEYAAVAQKLDEDSAYRAALAAAEEGAESLTEHYTTTLLRATDYSPDIDPASSAKTPRLFELRVYHSPTLRQLKALHERFAGPEIKIFHRVGVHPVLYTSTVFGANKPNLTYLTPFENLAAREKAWAAFAADPEWIKVRKESIDRHGQISSVIQIALYRATDYSPFK